MDDSSPSVTDTILSLAPTAPPSFGVSPVGAGLLDCPIVCGVKPSAASDPYYDPLSKWDVGVRSYGDKVPEKVPVPAKTFPTDFVIVCDA